MASSEPRPDRPGAEEPPDGDLRGALAEERAARARAEEELARARQKLAAGEELLQRVLLERGAMILRRLEEDKQRALERAELARRDLGTNLFRHGFFRRRLAFEVERARRTDEPIALLLVDFNRFTEFNERCGYEAGDDALQAVARSLEALWIARPGPRPAVLGRDEGARFAILLPAASAAEAELRAESARGLVERLPLGPPRLTVSVGGAAASGRAAAAPALLAAAAASLAAARREGENSAVVVRIDG